LVHLQNGPQPGWKIIGKLKAVNGNIACTQLISCSDTTRRNYWVTASNYGLQAGSGAIHSI
jgi:hypothetical protein